MRLVEVRYSGSAANVGLGAVLELDMTMIEWSFVEVEVEFV